MELQVGATYSTIHMHVDGTDVSLEYATVIDSIDQNGETVYIMQVAPAGCPASMIVSAELAPDVF